MLLYIIVGLLVLIAAYFILKASAGADIHSKFGVSTTTHTLISTDLGGSTKVMKLSRDGVSGIPDAVFAKKNGKEILGAEFKSRKYRNRVRHYEFYQLTLYLGHLAHKYPNHTVTGCLAYADGKVSVNFDPDVYQALIGMRSELVDALRAGKKPKTAALQQRMAVGKCNRHIRIAG